jgi:LuxR family transcriptional regulator, maltose regulon positive regulatory protein
MDDPAASEVPGPDTVATRRSGDERPRRERHELLATKLAIPQVRSDAVSRARLFAVLDQTMARRLILVSTPAGSGKTTLLAAWARRAESPVAWLSLDGDDNDPVRFWRYLSAALDRAGVVVGEQVLAPVGQRGFSSEQGVVTALANSLDTLPDEVALVLDDYHVIVSPAIHDGLAYLLDHIPPRLHVVLASRSDPPLPLARLRARDQLAELRVADLRFTVEESATFLRDVWRLDLPARSVVAVQQRTEGWAVGLQFAALSLQGRPEPERFLETFTGSHRYVLDYLTEEVLDRQTEETRSFLLHTSILERLSGPLCDALTGRSDGQETLERLERDNLFLIPLDETRRWYRFHHLFRDLLRAQLERSAPEVAVELHRRAAAWAEEHGLIEDAIHHHLSSGQAERAASLVERNLAETLRRGETVTLKRWLSSLPDEALRALPALSVACAVMAVHLGQVPEAERLLERAERGSGPHTEGRRFATDGGMVADVRAATALLKAEIASTRGDADATVRAATSALAALSPEEYGPRLWARWLRSLADWMAGRMETAENDFARLLDEARVSPDPHPLTTSCHTLGWIQQARGHLGAALRTYRDGLRFATEGGRFLPFHAGEAHLGIAQVLYALDQLDDALEHATQAVEMTRQMVEFQLPVFGLVTLARIRQGLGDAEGALATIEEACRLLPAGEVVSMWSPAEVERARIRLLQGDTEGAWTWTQERGLSDSDPISYPREADYLVLARVLLATGDVERAARLIERLDELAASHGRTQSLIELRAIHSLALQAKGDTGGALRLLDDALSIARPERYIRIFVDEGPPMAALIQRFIRVRRPGATISDAAREHAMQVVRAFRASVGSRAQANTAATGLIEPLTRREVEVLALIAAGRANREIADELFVTLDTVKRHVSHIFAKLGAGNRTEAVARAREFHLVP